MEKSQYHNKQHQTYYSIVNKFTTNMIEITYTAKNFKFKNCLIEIFFKKLKCYGNGKKILGWEERKNTTHNHRTNIKKYLQKQKKNKQTCSSC